MFKLNPNPTFLAAVALSVPGLSQPVEIQVTFKHKNKAALDAWMKTTNKNDAEILSEIIESWSGIKDDKGDEVPYSMTALTDLLSNYPVAHTEFCRAYLRELTEAKRKN